MRTLAPYLSSRPKTQMRIRLESCIGASDNALGILLNEMELARYARIVGLYWGPPNMWLWAKPIEHTAPRPPRFDLFSEFPLDYARIVSRASRRPK